jgi:hypothetical protein
VAVPNDAQGVEFSRLAPPPLTCHAGHRLTPDAVRLRWVLQCDCKLSERARSRASYYRRKGRADAS